MSRSCRFAHDHASAIAAIEILSPGILTGSLAPWRAGGFDGSHSLAFQLTVCTAAASLSVVSGFLSFIPGGLGVRDGVLFFVLTWIYDPAAAIVTAVLVRLLWLVAELTVSLLLYRAAGSPRITSGDEN